MLVLVRLEHKGRMDAVAADRSKRIEAARATLAAALKELDREEEEQLQKLEALGEGRAGGGDHGECVPAGGCGAECGEEDGDVIALENPALCVSLVRGRAGVNISSSGILLVGDLDPLEQEEGREEEEEEEEEEETASAAALAGESEGGEGAKEHLQQHEWGRRQREVRAGRRSVKGCVVVLLEEEQEERSRALQDAGAVAIVYVHGAGGEEVAGGGGGGEGIGDEGGSAGGVGGGRGESGEGREGKQERGSGDGTGCNSRGERVGEFAQRRLLEPHSVTIPVVVASLLSSLLSPLSSLPSSLLSSLNSPSRRSLLPYFLSLSLSCAHTFVSARSGSFSCLPSVECSPPEKTCKKKRRRAQAHMCRMSIFIYSFIYLCARCRHTCVACLYLFIYLFIYVRGAGTHATRHRAAGALAQPAGRLRLHQVPHRYFTVT